MKSTKPSNCGVPATWRGGRSVGACFTDGAAGWVSRGWCGVRLVRRAVVCRPETALRAVVDHENARRDCAAGRRTVGEGGGHGNGGGDGSGGGDDGSGSEGGGADSVMGERARRGAGLAWWRVVAGGAPRSGTSTAACTPVVSVTDLKSLGPATRRGK